MLVCSVFNSWLDEEFSILKSREKGKNRSLLYIRNMLLRRLWCTEWNKTPQNAVLCPELIEHPGSGSDLVHGGQGLWRLRDE